MPAQITGEQRMRKRPSRALAKWVAGAALLCCAGRATAALTVSPATIPNDFTGTVSLAITGLNTNGQTVMVEKYFDANNNNSIGSADLLMQQFKVTDGQVTSFGGQRNLNVPGDEDGVANKSILTKLYFTPAEIPGRLAGRFIFRVSPVGAGFSPFTDNLLITQQDHGGSGISGKVLGSGNPQAGAIVLIAAGQPDGDWDVAGIAMTDATGNFSLKLAPKSYFLIATKSGFTFNIPAAPRVTVPMGSFAVSADAVLSASVRTITGNLHDDSAAHAPLSGVAMAGQTQAGIFSFTFSDVAGNYTLNAPATACELEFLEWPLAQLGIVQTRGTVENSTVSVTGFDVEFPRATSLIYGSVLLSPLTFADTSSMKTTRQWAT